MKLKIITLAFASAILATSCKQELQPQESLPVVENAETVAPQQEAGFFQQPTEAAPAVTSAPGQTAAGMNPPHGQPGHRCDIAVGAPLNSAPNPGGEIHPQPQQVQPQVQPQVTQQPTKTAPGMNPPHGQPGHRCDIAVGAPLNSAPAKKNETAAVAPKPSATITPASVPTEVAEGMNPPHGQPGHKCDIAVGAPLPKG